MSLADHLQQPPRIVGVVDREVGVEAVDQRRLVAQNPHARRVKRRHPHRAGPRADQPHHPFPHLGGGLVGEGDGQDLPDPDVAGGHQVGDAPGQHRRLARARARDDQQRRALVHHRLALLWVEPVEQFVGFGCRVTCHSLRHTSSSHRPRSAAITPASSSAAYRVPTYRRPATLFALVRPLVAHSDSCSTRSADFSTGTGQRCPWLSCFPEPRGPLPDPGLVSL